MTDTATLVVFDPDSLRDKVDEECDWWTGEGDLAAEEKRGSLAYIDVGSDGVYLLTLLVEEGIQEGAHLLKESHLRVPSGRVMFGAAEWLPGEGEASADDLASVDVTPGDYTVRVYSLPTRDGNSGDYAVVLTTS